MSIKHAINKLSLLKEDIVSLQIKSVFLKELLQMEISEEDC